MHAQKLIELRTAIDKVDAAIVGALAKRGDLSRRIGALKKKSGAEVEDAKRKKKLIALRVVLGKKKRVSPSLVREIFEAIHTDSVKIQKRI